MEDLFGIFEKPRSTGVQRDPHFDRVTGIIRSSSHGEISSRRRSTPDLQPEHNRLFFARFSAAKDYEPDSGRSKRMRHRGVICESAASNSSNPEDPPRADRSYRPGSPVAHICSSLAAVANQHTARHDAEGVERSPLLKCYIVTTR